jgi:lipopolysaccharide export system protein LptC
MILTSAKEMSKSLVMRAPKVEGYTTNNRLYTVTAVRAFQDFRHADFIELEDLKGVFPFGHADQAFFNAKKGFLNRINRQMFFHGPLMVKTSDGMVTHLLSAHMNLATIQLETKERVEMSDGRKFLTANCMRVFDNGDKIIFNGGVRFMMILSHER